MVENGELKKRIDNYIEDAGEVWGIGGIANIIDEAKKDIEEILNKDLELHEYILEIQSWLLKWFGELEDDETAD